MIKMKGRQIRQKCTSLEGHRFLFPYEKSGGRLRSGGGGGTSILKVMGKCHWKGYDFAVINLSTGYLVALLWSSILAHGI